MFRCSPFKITTVFFISLLLTACGGGGDDGTSQEPISENNTGTATIGSAGGTLSDPHGTKLVVPPGALTEDILISLESHLGEETLPSPAPFIAGAHFEPDGLVFSKPVTITLPLQRTLIQGTVLPLFVFDPPRDAWMVTDFSVIVNNDGWSATGEISHFSDFVSLGPPHDDLNILTLRSEVSDVCNYRPFTEIFNDFVSQVSSTFEIGSKKIFDFSDANPIRKEACYELSGLQFVWNVESSIPNENDPDGIWISQEQRNLEETLGEPGNIAMHFYDVFDLKIADVNCGDRQVVYNLDFYVWWRCTAPQFSIDSGTDKMCKKENTNVHTQMMCRNEPMAGELIDFTATGPGYIAPVTDETSTNGAADSVLFAGNSGGTLTATASYLACQGQETEQDVKVLAVVEVQDAMTIEVSPPSASLCVGDSTHPSWIVLDHKGYPVDCYESSWSSSNPSVAQVNPLTGAISAISEGNALMTVVTEQATTTMGVAVGETCMSISPPRLCVEDGKTAKLSVIAGSAVDLGEIVWTSSDETVAVVDAAGNIAAQGEGPVRITAIAGGIMAEATVDVKDACLTVEPSNICLHTPIPMLPILPTNLQTLEPRIETAMDGHTVSYESSNESVVTIDATGTVTAHAGGDAIISASVDNVVTDYSYADMISVHVAGSLDEYRATPIGLSIGADALFLTDERNIYTQNQVVQKTEELAASCGGFPSAPDYYTITDFNNYGEYVGYYGGRNDRSAIYLDSSRCIFREMDTYTSQKPKAINDLGMIAIDVESSDTGNLIAIATRDGSVSYPYPFEGTALDLNNNGILLSRIHFTDVTWWNDQCTDYFMLLDATMGADPNALVDMLVEAPAPCADPWPMAINNHDIVVGNYRWGQYEDNLLGTSVYQLYADGIFLYYGGEYYDVPVGSRALDVNDSQDILGASSDVAFVAHVCPFTLETNVCDWIDDPYRSDAIQEFEQTELSCDGLDNDCDGLVDEGLITDPTPKQLGVCSGAVMRCEGREGWVSHYSEIPGYEFPEISCDGKDNDCDGLIDEGIDADGDSYFGIPLCGEVQDCDDTDTTVFPGATESCNGRDDNCDGVVDEGC